jgi:hypothetical protein
VLVINTVVWGSILDSSSDNEHNAVTDSLVPAEEPRPPSATRRRFAKNAIVGSAVLLSLGNRTAWGRAVPEECLSMTTWDSFTDGGFAFASYDPNNASQSDKLTKANKIVADGLDDTSFPGYACPVAQEPDNIKFGDKMSRQRDRFSK